MYNILIIILSCVTYSVAVENAEKTENTEKDITVRVVTSKGVIQGNKRDGYNTFFGVPYAKVNESRPFGPYKRYPNFVRTFIANDSSIMCPQVARKVGGQIQCLRLNIYVPHSATINEPAPVLVWFYGGGFVFGGAGDYGGEHLVKHDILVVTVNYRLGPYGFFCSDDPAIPGNQGLKDQVGALKWIKQYISVFGGDPSRVTIAGESYGGGAVDVHLYSKSDNLYDKAIIQSGSLYTPGFFVKRDSAAAIKMVTHLGFNIHRISDALRILSKLEPVVVMAAAKDLGLKLTTCKEKRFSGVQNYITKCRTHLKNKERIKDMPILIGYNSNEDFGTFANKPQEFYDGLEDIFYKNLRNHFALKKCELETLSNITRKFYLGSKEIGPESLLELSEYSSDFKLNYACEKSVNRFVEQGAKVYKYLFSYIGGSIYQNVSGAGATHTEELKYLFETDISLTTDEQRMIRDRMTTMWANFVKYGNPTPQTTPLLPVIWTPVTEGHRQYLDIDVEMTMKDHLHKERIAFWDLFMQHYGKKVK